MIFTARTVQPTLIDYIFTDKMLILLVGWNTEKQVVEEYSLRRVNGIENFEKCVLYDVFSCRIKHLPVRLAMAA